MFSFSCFKRNSSKTSGESIVGGPYIGGNYWSNPSGTGFSENCTDVDKDGIADSTYEIKNGTFDYLPLTEIPATTTTTTTTKHKSSANYARPVVVPESQALTVHGKGLLQEPRSALASIILFPAYWESVSLHFSTSEMSS
ncbi:NosD domain-containing protein [Methanosarcina acetivorans]|uniref:Periplasmic copper-binding protein NosD beta helix domain-containing protein n=1 Tax=Methanosarcina acetivorans (strain ATCC 35395 / DSM 2834 / JCM 12185 / C2A) TaxID=188937 RepID=Q8TLS2_METAC|nr:NosD domain-containing protein [Methanosarcina acetivorans]AAM06330.1 predicted protein [Methanosarcina acetivorans C2A]